MVIFHSYVSLPEGNYQLIGLLMININNSGIIEPMIMMVIVIYNYQ